MVLVGMYVRMYPCTRALMGKILHFPERGTDWTLFIVSACILMYIHSTVLTGDDGDVSFLHCVCPSPINGCAFYTNVFTLSPKSVLESLCDRDWQCLLWQ